jgi:hypothetical protein
MDADCWPGRSHPDTLVRDLLEGHRFGALLSDKNRSIE